MNKKDIDIRYVEIENTLALLQQCPTSSKVINDFYYQAKPIFLPHIGTEELFHDFIIKVINNINTIDFNKSVKNWLITLSKNIEINSYIKENRKKNSFIEFTNDLNPYQNKLINNNEMDNLLESEYEYDKKLYIIFNVLTPEERTFFESYYDNNNNNKNPKDRIKMCILKKSIKEKLKKNDY